MVANAAAPGGRPWLRYLLAVAFVGAGILHVIHPETYLRIMPPALPAPRLLVLLSGAAEVAGGLGLLLPATRRWAAWGLLALLVAVFPANVYMLQLHEQLHIPLWALWARLPLQPLLMWAVWRAGTTKAMS
ncbi:DoxX family protein [Hymenobacter arcticus]